MRSRPRRVVSAPSVVRFSVAARLVGDSITLSLCCSLPSSASALASSKGNSRPQSRRKRSSGAQRHSVELCRYQGRESERTTHRPLLRRRYFLPLQPEPPLAGFLDAQASAQDLSQH